MQAGSKECIVDRVPMVGVFVWGLVWSRTSIARFKRTPHLSPLVRILHDAAPSRASARASGYFGFSDGFHGRRHSSGSGGRRGDAGDVDVQQTFVADGGHVDHGRVGR